MRRVIAKSILFTCKSVFYLSVIPTVLLLVPTLWLISWAADEVNE